MGAAPGRFLDAQAEGAEALEGAVHERRAVGGDAFWAPLEDQLQRGRQRGDERKVAALAHLEAQGAGLVVVDVLDQSREVLRVAPGDPGLLERDAVEVAVAEPGEREGVGAEQPLVSRDDEGIGVERDDIDRCGADGLRAVEDERGPDLAGARADGSEIEPGAVRPVHGAHGDGDGGRVDVVEYPLAPSGAPPAVARGRHHAEFAALFPHQTPPRVHIAGKLLVDDDDVGTRWGVGVAGDRRDGVRNRGHGGDSVRLGSADQAGETLAHFLHGAEKVLRGNGLRETLGAQALDAGPFGRAGKRPHVGAVEVVEVVGQREAVALAG